MTISFGLRDSYVSVAGIGTIVADHVFVASGGQFYRYHGSRGGGTVWNILAHLAQAGFNATAYGSRAADGPGIEATGELKSLGVDISKLIESVGKRSLVFTQWLNDDIRHGPAKPQNNFSLECPICGRVPARDQMLEFTSGQFKPGETSGSVALVCADRLTSATVAAARNARAAGSFSALDLGGVAGLSHSARADLAEWVGEFDLVAMPAAVAAWLVSGPASEFSSRLLSNHTAVLTITRGKQGYELFLRAADGDTIFRKGRSPDTERVVDATGAGDAFMAALIGNALRLGKADGKDRRLHFRPGDRETLMAALTAAPVSVLGGVGARSCFPECPDRTDWGKRLAPLRGRTLDDLRRHYAEVRPCYFCALD